MRAAITGRDHSRPDAFLAAANYALDAAAPAVAPACDHDFAAAPDLETAGAPAARAHEVAAAPIFGLPSAAELDRWLASPSRRAA